MKFGAGHISRRNQLQWVALLALAVVLPTVSLLWFMSRVVANERFVVQQKLAALYQDKLADATAKTEGLFAARLGGLDMIKPAANAYALFTRLVLENHFQGLVIWDADASLVYPRSVDVLGTETPSGNPLSAAWRQEFAQQQYSEAASLYARLASDADPRVAIEAMLGRSRCLSRLGRLNEAIDECQKAAFAAVAENGDPALRLSVENARLLLLSLLKKSGPSQPHPDLLRRTVHALMADLYNPAGDLALLPANQNLFIAKKLLDAPWHSAAQDTPVARSTGDARGEDRGSGISNAARAQSAADAFSDEARLRLGKLAAAEELSIAAAETLRPFASRFDSFSQTDLGGPIPEGGGADAAEGGKPVYGLLHKTSSSTFLVLLSEAGIASALSGYHDVFARSESAYRILDASGIFVAGSPHPKGKPFAIAPLPEGFPGWKVELYFEGSDVFEKAARRQIAIYVWTGVLVIVLMLVAGAFATRAVGRQIRLNTMKNDFIATVSHELKTPLASMRVLIDTLLEGNVRDEKQAAEYLRLTAKENERLSRMIDNFLTFSRMERNKVAFSIADARPAAIANDAVESMKTKLAANNCPVVVALASGLPEIQADHDAIVTVLVNLLDNACKYTGDNKQISLKVFPEAGFVCFAVSDNGIGLARRHVRRIFDRFYQVDNSLARKAEGCGLGLSIVKFIIDGHKGTITVESKPGSGSIFTVRLPVGRRNGD